MNQIKNQISGIRLQNFQVFGKYTHIPLAPLTLIYGPNSAGKSSIIDALKIAKFFWTPIKNLQTDFYTSVEHQNLMLKSHYRRVQGNFGSDGVMKIDIELPARYGIPERVNNEVNSMLACLTFDKCKSGDGSVKVVNHSVYVDGEFFFQAGEEGFSINVKHAMASNSDFNRSVQYGRNENVEYPLSLEDGILKLPSKWANLNANLVVVSDTKNTFFNKEKASPNVIGIVDEFCDELSSYFRDWEYAISSVLEFGHVDPSRTIPTPSELTYILGDSFAVTANGIGDYFYLASDCLTQQLGRDFTDDEEVIGLTYSLDQLNHILSHHLFLERAYQIAADIQYIVSSETIKSSPRKQVADLGKFGAVVQLKLVDPEGRKFNFTEVGSGLGYVLPVLLKGISHDQCFIEQPELHLHPALQSALGDIFIDLANLNIDSEDMHSRTLLIETHSEHVLLRMLKRIRQTSADVSIEINLQLHAEDLAVLYFDPLPTGETVVKRLRITDEGEFMDRWPHGFFEERDRELFDE